MSAWSSGYSYREGNRVKSLARFIVRVADLVEAEGRSLREATVQVGLAVAASLGAAAVGVAGIGLLVWGLYAALEGAAGPIGAAIMCGVVLLACAGGLVWVVIKLGKSS